MAKRSPRPAAADPSASRRCTLVVCRGCCCGIREFTGLNHASQYTGLRRSLDGVATVRASDCLDACEQANVIVVQPSMAGRLAGGRPVWLAMVNDHDVEADLIAWIEAGGPGLADAPAILDLYEYKPSRRVAAGVDG